MPARRSQPDASQEALRAVERVTGAKPVKGEDLLGSPEMKRKFAAAKKRLKSAKPLKQARPSGAGAG
jgi:hypothetical protein